MAKGSDEYLYNMKKLQDDDGDWYWIPALLVDKFKKDEENLLGKEYMDDPKAFDEFNDKYSKYRTGGSPDIAPPAFSPDGIISKHNISPEVWEELNKR